MAAPVFELVADELERRTDLGRLEARGTVRLALKDAGLDAGSVTRSQMAVALEKVLPGQLGARGIAEPQAVCRLLAETLARQLGLDAGEAADPDSPEAIFDRLGR